MTQKLTIHKNKEHPVDALWWTPFFEMQKQINNSLQKFAPGFIPVPFLQGEANIMQNFQDYTQRVFGDLFNNRQMFTPWLTGKVTEPYINIVESKDKLKITADVPGVDADHIDVSVSANALIIQGSREECIKKEGENYLRHECCSGSFSRTIALPENADLQNATASFDKNVLTIEVPKKAGAVQDVQKLKIAIQQHKKAA